MSELPDLTGLAVESAEQTTPPAFESLVRRAGIRGRRQAVGVVIATAIVAIGGGVLLVPHRGGSSASPVHQATTSPTGSPPVTPRRRLAALYPAQVVAQGRLISYAENSAGGVMTTWRVCVDAQRFCRYAWRLDTGRRVVRGLAPAGGSVLTAYATGDVIAPDGKGGLMVIDPRTRLQWPLAFSPGDTIHEDGIVSSDGTVWVLQGPGASPGTTKVLWKRGGFNAWCGGAWSKRTLSTATNAVPGALAVSGAHVAALSSFDWATSLPVGTLAISTDGGQTWDDLHKSDLPFPFVSDMAATSGGVLFVSDVAGGLWRSSDSTWTSFERMTGVPKVYGLQPAGAGVIAQVAVKAPRLALIDAQGHATLTLPFARRHHLWSPEAPEVMTSGERACRQEGAA